MADRWRFKNAAAYGAKSKSSSEIQVWSCGFVAPPENIALFGPVLWLLAHAIDATRNTQRCRPALSISAHTHASVRAVSLITRVNRWLG